MWFTLYPGVGRNPAAAAAPSEREAGAAGAADERAGEVEVRARVRDRQSLRGALRRLRGEPSTLSA